ncbi:hypothetical protein FHR99_003151 [Litorivivens lipolytica]|uniref:Penicillin-binding protein activator LpoB n=1 Tax=Litorivivens lipolytica TaxID=1524264 RepID=A0A7W4W7I1_9GAMM|nr:penicillin-binding protein activator LpoB [Litorivivens lipolytica]MBB3048877.1 hypothetical protein [Litorivivens lipolytica]
MKKILSILLFTVAITGCASQGVQLVDTSNDTAGTVMGLEYRDFEKAAAESVQSMLATGAVTNPNGGRYVMAVSRVINDTMQRIDTDQLIKKIRIELLNSGKVVVTTAVGLNGPEDQMAYAARELRGNDEFDQSRVARKRSLQAPDLSLSGKIMQRNHAMGRGQTQVEYSFQLTLTDINTGLAIWEGETPIVKRGSSKTVSW